MRLRATTMFFIALLVMPFFCAADMTETQVREIVRDELAKAGIDVPADQDAPATSAVVIPKTIGAYPHSNIITKWPAESKYWQFHPQSMAKGCLYMGRDWLTVAMQIIRDTDNGVPLILADSCAGTGSCAGHNGLHDAGNGRTFDICYPTLKPVDDPLKGIYKDYKQQIIDPDVFDWQRFYKMCVAIKAQSPQAIIMCGDAVWQYVNRKLGDDYMPWFKLAIQHYRTY